jgi:hypothetical protein
MRSKTVLRIFTYTNLYKKIVTTNNKCSFLTKFEF